MLQVKLREYENPWPAIIGIDEHSFRRNKATGEMEFVTVFVDHVNKRMRAIVLGRDKLTLLEAIKDIKGATAVRVVSIDLSASYREFVPEAFPNAAIVADKFHVMRLFGNLIKRERIDAFGDKRSSELSQLLKKPQKFLSKAASNRLREILIYYDHKITNARVEGFNGGAEPISARVSSAGATDIAIRKTTSAGAWEKSSLSRLHDGQQNCYLLA